MAVAHVAFNFGARHQGRHRVDHNQIDGVTANQRFDDFEGLLAVVGLAEQQIFNIDTDALGVGRVQGVLSVYKGGCAAGFLDFGDGMKSKGGFAGRLRAVNFKHPAPGNTAAKSYVQA